MPLHYNKQVAKLEGKAKYEEISGEVDAVKLLQWIEVGSIGAGDRRLRDRSDVFCSTLPFLGRLSSSCAFVPTLAFNQQTNRDKVICPYQNRTQCPSARTVKRIVNT